MAYEKNTVNTGLSLQVYASDTIPIPHLGLTPVTGTTTGAATNKLIDSNADFINSGVTVGSIVYQEGTGVATVTAIDSATTLSLSANIMGAPPKDYTIYLSDNTVPKSSEGCLLYVGSNIATMTVDDSFVDVKVKTVAGNIVTFWKFPVGNCLPVQVVQLYSTGTGLNQQNNCIAIW